MPHSIVCTVRANVFNRRLNGRIFGIIEHNVSTNRTESICKQKICNHMLKCMITINEDEPCAFLSAFIQELPKAYLRRLPNPVE